MSSKLIHAECNFLRHSQCQIIIDIICTYDCILSSFLFSLLRITDSSLLDHFGWPCDLNVILACQMVQFRMIESKELWFILLVMIDVFLHRYKTPNYAFTQPNWVYTRLIVFAISHFLLLRSKTWLYGWDLLMMWQNIFRYVVGLPSPLRAALPW